MKKPKMPLSRIGSVLFLLGVSSCLGLFAQEPEFLNIHSIGETRNYSIPLDNIDKVTFDDSRATLWSSDGEQSMPYSQLGKITFGAPLSAIDEMQVTASLEIGYRSSDRCIVVASSTTIESLALYNLQGRLVLQLSPGREYATIAIDDLPAGVYIVHASNGERVKTQKIIKSL